MAELKSRTLGNGGAYEMRFSETLTRKKTNQRS